MVKVNLKTPVKDWRSTMVPVFLSLAFMALALLVLPAISGKPVEPRTLRVEETEVVLAAADRLESRHPDLKGWLQDFRDSFLHGEVEAHVRFRWLPQEQVAVQGGDLVFAPSYFESDSARQEQSLLKALAELKAQWESVSEGVALGE